MPDMRSVFASVCVLVGLVGAGGCGYAPPAAERLALASDDELAAEMRRVYSWFRSGSLGGPDARQRLDEARASIAAEKIRRAGWSEDDAARVARGRVWVGATPEQVLFAWGPPLRVDRERWASGIDVEAWRYGPDLGPFARDSTVVYFAGDRVLEARVSSSEPAF